MGGLLSRVGLERSDVEGGVVDDIVIDSEAEGTGEIGFGDDGSIGVSFGRI